MEPGPEREKQRIALEKMCELMEKHHGKKGFRIDLQIMDPLSNQEVWVDATRIHPTCTSRIRGELK